MNNELNDMTQFKDLVSQIDIKSYTQAEYVQEVDRIFKELFTAIIRRRMTITGLGLYNSVSA